MTTGSKLTIIALALAALLPSAALRAEDGGAFSGYAPYSIYALGDLSMPGSAYNRSMGGTGIASRNNRFINTLNPAAVTARDSLAVMTDFSMLQKNVIFHEDSKLAANNTCNISSLAFSLPLFNKTAAVVGITPFASTGYRSSSHVTDPMLLAEHGTIVDSYSGQGSLYQVYGAFGYNPFGGLSLGVQYNLYFGNVTKTFSRAFESESTRNIESTDELQLSGNNLKFGVQYEQIVGKKVKLGVGATWATSGIIKSADEKNGYSATGATFAPELGIGLSFNYMEKFRAQLDYTRADWTVANLGAIDSNDKFASCVSEALRFGMEYTPNRNDIRYYRKRVSYRAGAYCKNEYYTVESNGIAAYGITFGATLPVFRWYNGLTLGLDLGRRSSIGGDGISEMFVGFSFGVNLFDIWFQKPRYE
ncbi:MAG: hypothetical protein KBS55_00490 [Bacteroidales bacterium]|nr:hypothetical protein [Candidatus Cryptobacteroides aphodequi]